MRAEDQKERRRHALLQAAATIYARFLPDENGNMTLDPDNWPEAVDAAEGLLAEIERREP